MGKAAPKAKITLDKERTMIMDLNALEAFEDATGKRVQDIGENPGVKDLKYLVWSCLIHEDEKLKPSDVGKWIHPNNMEKVAAKISDMLEKNA